jgi:hypothetical protein
VSFTLDIDYYALSLVDIPYTVHSPPYKESGFIEGPGNPVITVPTASMTALQTMVPFTIAVGLISLLKKGIM